MDRRDDGVRGRCQEAIDEMRPGDRLRLRAAVSLELGPDAGEHEQRSAVVERKPDDVLLLGLRVHLGRVLGEAVRRHKAAVLGPQGARLIGVYDSQVAFGQSRVLLVWTRLIMQNGRSIVLERQPGADTAGYSGLEDEVDSHWKE